MKEEIRILQVIGIMNRGGAETMLMNVYRHMDRTKIQFDFVEHCGEQAVFDKEIEALGGKVYRCPHFCGTNYFEYRRWWKSFFAEHSGEYQIIHGHIGSTAAIYLKIAKRSGLYTIAHSHSSGRYYSLKVTLYHILSYNTRNIAHYFFACSKNAGLDRFGKRVVTGECYRGLKNAIVTNDFQYAPDVRREVRAELSLRGKLVIGHVGRFTAEKNHAFLLDIFKEMVAGNSNIRLLLVGDGPLRRAVEKKAEELGILSSILFTGVRSDVNRLLQAMDALVFPSLYEGLPVTLIEAQTSGLPCIISDKVPEESILIDGLVTVRSLGNSAQEWAEHTLSRIGEIRVSRCDEVCKRGYDIAETAKWLGGFYLEKYHR